VAPAPWSVTEADGGVGPGAVLGAVDPGAADVTAVLGALLVVVLAASVGELDALLPEQAANAIDASSASAPRRLGVVITR
jgi:hypothetical protein